MNIENHKITGPYHHRNLAIFLVHGPDTVPADTYATLEEALAAQQAVVHETGNVGQLEVENLLADKALFIQSGEIVRGGRQDRTLGVDLVVPARSGRVPVPSFCVEMGRWHRRRNEAVNAFSSSKHNLASSKLKLAAKLAASQHEVWEEVSRMQARLSRSIGDEVCHQMSPSSLELTLEHQKVQEHQAAFLEALGRIVDDKADAVGFAFAINGELNSAEVYANHALFSKLWRKLLEAAAVEAIAETAAPGPHSTPDVEQVRALLRTAEAGAEEERAVTDRVRLRIRRDGQGVSFETHDRGLGDGCIHKHVIRTG